MTIGDSSIQQQSEAAQALIKYFDAEDSFAYDFNQLRDVQLQAINELFQVCRKKIRILDQRATDVGLENILSLDDVVPLLFSHQTYKSYPESFVKENKWAGMNKWLDTLSVNKIGDIDVSDVIGTDAWIAKLSEHEHYPLISSGTSGKTSFLNRSKGDCDFNFVSTAKSIRATKEITSKEKMAVILLGPKNGAHIFVGNMRKIAEEFGREDATYWLSDLEISENDIKRQAELRNRINDGSATPAEIQELEEHGKQRQQQMRKEMEKLAAALIKHKDEPVFIVGLWLPHFLLMQEAHAQGLGDGELHPQSLVFFGGGLKGAKLPSDYREQISRFHGLDPFRYFNIYGMTELSSGFPACREGAYHISPWIIPLILNAEGDKLINQKEGVVEGRMAFFDTAIEGRWGGVITSDKVEVNFSSCACGRHSPSVVNISRYADLPGGDDKLSCAGTMSSYVRGVIDE